MKRTWRWDGNVTKMPKTALFDLISVPAKFGGPVLEPSQWLVHVPILAPKSRNFAGTLIRSIPTQVIRFWDISGTLKKLCNQSFTLCVDNSLSLISKSGNCTAFTV